MKKYLIINEGCDDSTDFEVELTDEEFETILKIAKENNNNRHYHCQPKISIYDKYVLNDGYYNVGEWVDGEYIEYKDLTKEKNNE